MGNRRVKNIVTEINSSKSHFGRMETEKYHLVLERLSATNCPTETLDKLRVPNRENYLLLKKYANEYNCN